ncbi:MAG: carbohydrate ABC transporter permease [Chloroflexota bacterium]|nr:carbohydrate ABC transporter permease [Chloroflexota bacterium]
MRYLTDARVSGREDRPARRLADPAAATWRRGEFPARFLNRRLVGRILTYGVLSLGSVLFLAPYVEMVLTSFMGPHQFRDAQMTTWRVTRTLQNELWPDPWTTQGYMAVWEAAPVLSWIVNSLILVVLGLFGQTFVSILVAFGFARTQLPGRNFLFIVVLATLMLPYQMFMGPWYAIFREIGRLGSLWSVALPDLWGNAFYIFIFRQFFLTIPVELDEAAEIDGANLLQVLFRVVVPLSTPAIATVAVFNIVAKWNQFFWPLVFIQWPERLPVAVGIRWFRTQHGYDPQLLMVTCIISMAPVVMFFLIAQRYFLRGAVLAGVRP